MLNDKKTIRAWAMYDWANSAYNLIVTSAIFPAYYSSIVEPKIQIGSKFFTSDSIASWSISLAFLIIAFISPMLSGIADAKGNKKTFMQFFCTIGALACMALFFFQKMDGVTNIWYGVSMTVIACIGYCGSLVFYNAYLPEIASIDNQDDVSAKGFIMGYIGSVSLLVVCLAFILLNNKMLWVDNSLPPRISFVAVGLWWLGFSLIPFKVLKNGIAKKVENHKSVLQSGYEKLILVCHQLRHLTQLKRYLAAFFFITMGVQTIMYMATYFAAKEINLQTQQLIIVILIIQLVAIAGAYLFSRISDIKGNTFTLAILVCIWIAVCCSASFLVFTVTHFYILAFVVGLIMGGTQSLCRSTFSKMLPTQEENKIFEFETNIEKQEHNFTSFFSFYDFTEKIGIVIGTVTFGIISNVISMRMSAFSLSAFFVVGLVILLTVKFNFKSNEKFSN